MTTRRGRTQAYATGNKVYGAGRPMPTIGPVNKAGYRERDAKYMIWKNAISRRLGNTPAAPTGGVQTAPPNSGPSDSLKIPVIPHIGSNNALQASPSGQMNGNPNAPGLNNLPYDPAYTGVKRAIENRRAKFNAGLAEQRANLDLEANAQKRDIDQAAPDILRRLTDDFASRGMGHSGRHIVDRGKQQNEFAERKAQIDRLLASERSGIDREAANFEAGLESELSQAEFDYIRSLTANAGDLGLVKDEPIIEQAPPPDLPVQQQAPIAQAPVSAPPVANPYQPPVPTAPQQSAPIDLVNRPGGVRALDTFDQTSRQRLTNGAVVVGGNGYRYAYNPLTSRVERVG